MTDEMRKRAQAIVCCLIVAILFASCSETITNPSTPGSGLLMKGVVIKRDTLSVTSDTTFLQRIVTDAILLSPLPKNLVGKDDIYTAYTAIRFSIATPRDTIRVLSARMLLRLVTWSGSASGTFAINVYPINKDSTWTESSLLWSQAASTGFYDPSSVKGSYSSTVGADTQVISVPIDTAMVRGWIASNTTTNNGIILIPQSSCSIIRGIHAFDVDTISLQPTLEVIAQGTNATIPDTTLIQIGSDTYVANASPFPLSPQRLFTQAGISYHSRLKFDTSRLPRGAVINSAELLLERDPALTRVNRFTASPQPNVYAMLSADSSNYEATSASGSIRAGTTDTFTFDVVPQVQYWTNGNNYGLVLRQPSSSEYGTLDRFAFYSNDAQNAAQHPRIIVKYSVFQN